MDAPKKSRRSFLKQSSKTVFATTALSGISLAGQATGFAPEGFGKTILRFAVASDGHYGEKGTPFDMYFQNLVDWLNQEKASKGLDLCVINGDLFHDAPEFLPAAKNYFDQFQMPYFATKGNHDQVTAEEWEQTFGYPENHVHILGSYAFFLGTTSNKAGEYLCANVEWLKTALARHQDKSHIFVFLHISQKDWVPYSVNCPEVTNLLESQTNVTAVFHGHNHAQHGVKYSNGKPYFFDGHFGGSWGQEYKGYRIVEVDENGKIFSYQVNPLASQQLNAVAL